MATFLERVVSSSIEEAGESVYEGRPKKSPSREGYASGIPIGGANENNQSSVGSLGLSGQDRTEMLQELLMAYQACVWVSACVDVIARTATAGGIEVVPETNVLSPLERPEPTDEVRRLQALFDYVNPQDDIRQLMRRVMTDMLVFGDAYLEVVWVGKYPAALYPLDPTTLTIISDEHGKILSYHQETTSKRQANFKPREVIHFRFDNPGDSLYGLSPTQKNRLSIETWLFTAALVKETMRRGDPFRLHIDWPLGLPDSDIRRFGTQYSFKNIGPKNIGNPIETKGGTQLRELGVNQINNWLNVLQQRRDEILSGFGVPPSKVGVIESGNIGGGTGTSQDKYFRVNTVGPIQEIILEKIKFHLVKEAFNIEGWEVKFGVVDWRDDEVIETIRDQRIRNGSWTLDRARADIGEPPIPGGDQAVLVDRQNIVLWKHVEGLSEANLELVQNQVKTSNMVQMGKTNPASGDVKVATAASAGGKPPQEAPVNGPNTPGSVESKIETLLIEVLSLRESLRNHEYGDINEN
jgi:HK97 family phage portal protein